MLRSLKFLKYLEKLESLDVQACYWMEDIRYIKQAPNLKYIKLTGELYFTIKNIDSQIDNIVQAYAQVQNNLGERKLKGSAFLEANGEEARILFALAAKKGDATAKKNLEI